MEPDGELMQNCKTLIWACIYHVLERCAISKSTYFSLHFSVLGWTLSREGSGRRLFWISVILGSVMAVHFRYFLASFSRPRKGGRDRFQSGILPTMILAWDGIGGNHPTYGNHPSLCKAMYLSDHTLKFDREQLVRADYSSLH